MNTKDSFIEFCYKQHDIVCNQKYGDGLPYSFHLKMVSKVAEQFIELIPKTKVGNGGIIKGPIYSKERDWVMMGAAGHDLIEDARLTYNDVLNLSGSKHVADIIYACTEDKGRSREERHSDKFYKDLSQDKFAVFVKLCDIIANVKYSILTNSKMFEKYKQEHNNNWNFLYRDEFKPMFNHLDKLFEVH